MSTSKLREIQETLLRVFQHGDRIPESPEFSSLASQIAAGSARLTPEEQLDIYREQFFLRHLGCLQEDFPGVEALVGCCAFEELGRAYLKAHPPTEFSLRDLGAKLPDFLESTDLGFTRRDVLIDMARLEWALVDAFDAEDRPPMDPVLLQNTPPDAFDSATLVFDPSITLLALRNPIHTIHETASEGNDFELPEARPCWLVVYRRLDLALDWQEIPELAFRSLTLLRGGLPLAEALDQVASTLTEQGELELLTTSVGAWFSDWVQRGWIRDLALPS